MKKLETIQTKEKLNEVYAVDEQGAGGAHHAYSIESSLDGCIHEVGFIQFQNGARNMEGSIPGVLDVDLLEIVRDRLQSFQAGPFASHYNEHALKHINEALYCMNARVEDRIKRNVLGKHSK